MKNIFDFRDEDEIIYIAELGKIYDGEIHSIDRGEEIYPIRTTIPEAEYFTIDGKYSYSDSHTRLFHKDAVKFDNKNRLVGIDYNYKPKRSNGNVK